MERKGGVPMKGSSTKKRVRRGELKGRKLGYLSVALGSAITITKMENVLSDLLIPSISPAIVGMVLEGAHVTSVQVAQLSR